MAGDYQIGNVTFNVKSFTLEKNEQGKYSFVATLELFKDGATKAFREMVVNSREYAQNLAPAARTQIDQALAASMNWLEQEF